MLVEPPRQHKTNTNALSTAAIPAGSSSAAEVAHRSGAEGAISYTEFLAGALDVSGLRGTKRVPRCLKSVEQREPTSATECKVQLQERWKPIETCEVLF